MTRNMMDMKSQREELARTQISELQNQVTTLQVQKDLLDSNHARCVKDLESVKTRYEQLKSVHDETKEQKLRLEHRVETLENNIHNLHDQLDDFVPPPLPFDPTTTSNTSSTQAAAAPDPVADSGANLQKEFDNLMNQILNDRAKFKEEEDEMNKSMNSLFTIDDNVK